MKKCFVILCIVLFGILPAEAAKNKEFGYYYLGIGKTEKYTSSRPVFEKAGVNNRQVFVGEMLSMLLSQPTPLQFSILTGGEGAKKLFIVATHDDFIDTEFRARALLSRLRIAAREQRFFEGQAGLENARFLDFCKMLGFTKIVVSDGSTFTLTVNIK